MRTNLPFAGPALVVALLALVAPGRPAIAAPAAAPPGGVPASAPVNAAVYYRQAFALLPHKGQADAAALQYGGDAPPTEQQIVVARKYARAVEMLRAGSAAPHCDWGLAHEKGPELALPELGSARLLSSLVWIRTVDEVRQKQPAEALDDVAALLVLARRLGKEPIIICKLFEEGLTNQAVEEAADVLREPTPPEALRRFRQRLTALPESQPVADAWKGEGAWLIHWFHDLEKEDPQGRAFSEGGRLWKLYSGGDAATSGKAMDVLRARWADPKVRAADLAAVHSAFDAGAAVLDAGPNDEARVQQEWEKARSASPMALLLTPASPDKVREVVRAADLRLELLKAAVDVRLGGADAIKSTRDPYGNGPFGYKALPGGFELSSKLAEQGKPVTLRIAPRQAPAGAPHQ